MRSQRQVEPLTINSLTARQWERERLRGEGWKRLSTWGGRGGRGQLTSNTVGLISMKSSGSFGKALIAIARQIKKARAHLCVHVYTLYTMTFHKNHVATLIRLQYDKSN